ncbi:MAG: hypothetical protein V2A79_11210 [Planctomycetota bacterium]
MIDLYARMLTTKLGSAKNARKVAEQMVDQVKSEAEAEGTLHRGYAVETILNRANSDPALRAWLEARRADGVTDDDVRWWYSLHELERRMMILEESTSRAAIFLGKQREGSTPEQAAAEVRRSLPMYGDPTDTEHTTGEDRPLPDELRRRVNLWLQKVSGDPEAFRRRLASATSYNALIRAELLGSRSSIPATAGEAERPPVPSIADVGAVIEWFLTYDSKLDDVRAHFPGAIGALKAEIATDVRAVTDAAQLQARLDELSATHGALLERIASGYAAGSASPDDYYAEATCAAKLRILGYFFLRRYGIQPK